MSTDLPHIVPGQPRRSMYGEHNTHDEQVALTAAAYQRMATALGGLIAEARASSLVPEDRDPIRVIAEVGRPVREVEA